MYTYIYTYPYTYTNINRYSLAYHRATVKSVDKTHKRQVVPVTDPYRDLHDPSGTFNKDVILRFEKLFGLCKKHIKDVEHLRMMLDKYVYVCLSLSLSLSLCVCMYA